MTRGETEAAVQAIRVMMVDDSLPFLAAAQGFLVSEPSLRVVGAFTSARAALAQVESLQPDVILLDLFMPGMNGLEATRLFKARPDAPRVILVTMDDSATLREAAASHGADGFVPKAHVPTQLIPLIREICG